MAYQFYRVDLFIFDVHFTLKPLTTAALLQENFRFLVDPALYAKQYLAPSADTENFKIRPLTPRERKREHFWKYYGTSPVVVSTDAWSLQLPFVCFPKAEVTVATKTRTFGVTVRPVIYLFPLGWSTNLECRIQGKIEENELINFIGRIRSSSERPFTIDQRNYSLSRLFEALAVRLRKDLFLNPDSAEDVAKTPRHIVISLSQFDGPIQRYRPQFPQDVHMPDADRALMHSILLGENISVGELAARESGKKFTLTHFGQANFAITYFDIGTLLFMQNQAQPAKQRRKSLGCLVSNVRKLSMTSLALLAFYEELTDIEQPDTTITALQRILKTRLRELRKRYNNAVCHTWYKHYGRLSPFAGES